MKIIHMKMDRFYYKIFHDHQIEQKENESKDFVDMLSSSRIDNYKYTFDNMVKGIINVILILPHVNCIPNFLLDLFIHQRILLVFLWCRSQQIHQHGSNKCIYMRA